MLKRILLTVLALVVVVGILGGIKGLQISALMAQGRAFAPPPESVTAVPARMDEWQSTVSAIGSLSAVQGVTVSAEVPGVVRKIAFESGAEVRRGAVLIELDQSSEQAELRAAEAAAHLAKANLARTKHLSQVGARSEADFDAALAEGERAEAQVINLRAVLDKKVIRAPFAGRLGIRQVSLGQFLEGGAPIVSLQSFDPIYVDAALPQQWLAKLGVGQSVRVTADAFEGERFTGKLTTINPEVDRATRNVDVQATLRNSEGRMRPGMFVEAEIMFPEVRRVLTIPATAVIHAPYGDSVYVIERKESAKGKPRQVVRQQFVRLGETRGDIVAVTSGLEVGQRVVTSGAFKLRPGSEVDVQDELAPAKLAPKPKDS